MALVQGNRGTELGIGAPRGLDGAFDTDTHIRIGQTKSIFTGIYLFLKTFNIETTISICYRINSPSTYSTKYLTITTNRYTSIGYRDMVLSR